LGGSSTRLWGGVMRLGLPSGPSPLLQHVHMCLCLFFSSSFRRFTVWCGVVVILCHHLITCHHHATTHGSVGEEELHDGLDGTEAGQHQSVTDGHEGVGQARRGRSLACVAVKHHLVEGPRSAAAPRRWNFTTSTLGTCTYGAVTASTRRSHHCTDDSLCLCPHGPPPIAYRLVRSLPHQGHGALLAIHVQAGQDVARLHCRVMAHPYTTLTMVRTHSAEVSFPWPILLRALPLHPLSMCGKS
jgi:hypothetical protein